MIVCLELLVFLDDKLVLEIGYKDIFYLYDTGGTWFELPELAALSTNELSFSAVGY